MKKPKPLKLSASMVKRVRRFPGGQDTKGACVVCGGNFQTCPHSYADTCKIYKAAEMAETLGLEIK